MKKSIAFLGALLFGSVTFGQVTKNDSIKKPSSRKVSADDLKNLPVDSENSSIDGHIKGKTLENNQQFQTSEKHPREFIKHASDASAGKGSNIKGSVTQKGKDGIIVTEKMGGDGKATTTEKQHYTIKMTNANNKSAASGDESGVIKEGATTQKKHVSNIKWTPGKAPIGKTVKDSLPTPSTKSTDMFLKIGDIKGEK